MACLWYTLCKDSMADPQGTPFGAGQTGMPPSQPEQGRVQPPPPPEISMRTMGSDVRSLEQGQTKPVPERIFQRPPVAPEQSNEPVFRPDTIAPGSSIAPSPKQGKRGIWILISSIIIVGLAALGYFVVYPLLFPDGPPTTPSPSPLPSPSPSPSALHRSLFSIPAAAQTMLKLEPLDRTTIMQAMAAVAEQGIVTGLSQEIIIVHPDESQVRSGSFFPAFGAFSADQLSLWFEDDFTAFLFYNDLGVWPGYVLKIKPGTPNEDVESALAQLETIPLEPFFLEDPGTFGAFRDGNIGGHPNRYAVGEMPGAAFEYLLVNDVAILTTSYPAAQEAVRLLGL